MFEYEHEIGSLGHEKRGRIVELRISGTLFNPMTKGFYGKTSIPRKIKLINKATNFSKYGVARA